MPAAWEPSLTSCMALEDVSSTLDSVMPPEGSTSSYYPTAADTNQHSSYRAPWEAPCSSGESHRMASPGTRLATPEVCSSPSRDSTDAKTSTVVEERVAPPRGSTTFACVPLPSAPLSTFSKGCYHVWRSRVCRSREQNASYCCPRLTSSDSWPHRTDFSSRSRRSKR